MRRSLSPSLATPFPFCRTNDRVRLGPSLRRPSRRIAAHFPCDLCLVALVACWGSFPSASADTVELKDGKTVQGEVIEDIQGQPLVFRYQHKGEWRTANVPRERIARYRRELGNQADGEGAVGRRRTAGNSRETKTVAEDTAAGGLPALPSFQDLTIDDLIRTLARLLPPVPPQGGEVVVLQLRGPLAPARIHRIGEIISDTDLHIMLAAAMRRKPAVIVLSIDSGGGLVDEMNQIIERLIRVQSSPSNQRVVAWVDMGGSAAALIALACKEIVMHPTGRMGSATAIVASERVPAPRNAREQKEAAMDDARRRQVATMTGRSPLVQAAMEFPERCLWGHESLGFAAVEQAGAGWTALDDSPDRPLAMEASELVRYGIASKVAATETELVASLGLPVDSAVVEIDLLDDQFQQVIAPVKAEQAQLYAEVEKAEAAFTKKLDKYFDNLLLARRDANRILQQTTYADNDLALLKTSLTRCHIPFMKDETRKLLQEWAPERLSRYETGLEIAKGNISRAVQSTRVQGSTLPIGSIASDIQITIEAIFYARWGISLDDE